MGYKNLSNLINVVGWKVLLLIWDDKKEFDRISSTQKNDETIRGLLGISTSDFEQMD